MAKSVFFCTDPRLASVIINHHWLWC